jgi:uncharacterized protein
MSLSTQQRTQIERIVGGLLADGKGIVAAVVATTDGMSVASQKVSETLDESKLAAIASSIGAIGAVVGDETGLGACRLVMVQSERGYTVIVEVAHEKTPMIVSIVADASAVLGNVIYEAREAAAAISQLL